ncbi:MAG TPA: aspartate kinase [Dehalococcoidia bacterium]|nr:aspartate kinase [Dehalococcoidia bacterium]
MTLIVQKYGGSSVADAEKIKNVARRIAVTRDEGHEVVVAVSAMGKTTNNLIELAYRVNEHPDGRELDALLSTGELVSSTLLAMALEAMGYEAISLSGAQAGIRTTATHRRARILQIESKRIEKELENGNIVIVAGYQGITDEMDVTTLGRGASDTTAVALAASLKAEVCQIYTDVEGVFTADPNVEPDAQPLKEIGYQEMLELASHGARVMHGRAVELGELYNVPILVSSSFTGKPGTLIHGGMSMEVRNKVSSIAHDLDVAKITVVGVPDQPGIAAALFEPLAAAGISIDTIVQNASIDNITDLTFTVAGNQVEDSLKVVEPIARDIGARECVSDSKLGKVSIVGTGMQNTPGFASRMFSALSEKGINIQLITTSEIRITCIIEEGRVKEAVRALHKAFRLDAKE